MPPFGTPDPSNNMVELATEFLHHCTITAPALEAALAPGGSFTGAAVPAKSASGSGVQLS